MTQELAHRHYWVVLFFAGVKKRYVHTTILQTKRNQWVWEIACSVGK